MASKPCANCGHLKGVHRTDRDGICPVIVGVGRFVFGAQSVECGCAEYREVQR